MSEIWEDPEPECMPRLLPNPMLGWRSLWHTSDLPWPILCGKESWVKVCSEKGFSKDFITHCHRLQGNVQPCSCDYKIFMCSCLWPGLDEKLKSEIQSARGFQKKKTCLEIWDIVCSYLFSNNGRTISWTGLWGAVQADIPDNWNLSTDGLLSEDWILLNLVSFYSQAETGWMTDFRLYSYVWILAVAVQKQIPYSFCCLCFGKGNCQKKARTWYWRQHQFSCSVKMCLHAQVSTDRQVSWTGWCWRCGGNWGLSLWMFKFHLSSAFLSLHRVFS